ncbi:MAG: DinB family protein [Saprospiraceae bacterium]
MEANNQISKRCREVLLDGTWIANTNFQDQLSDVTWEQAQMKFGSLNSILALTFHINYYLAGMLQVFEGGTLDIRDKYSFDYQHIASKDDWEKLLTQFFKNAELFAEHVARFSEYKLEEYFVDPKYGSYRRNIEGMIEHSYYHLGQVSLLKKMISDPPY